MPKATITQATVVGTFTFDDVEIETDSVGEFHLSDIPDVIGDLRGTQMIVIVIDNTDG